MGLKRVKKEDFVLSDYVKNGLHTKKSTSFVFKVDEIKKLPLLDKMEGKDETVDLFDYSESRKGFSLVLRISHSKKTFYLKARAGKTVARGAMRKLGDFGYRTANRSRPAKGLIELSEARKKFHELADQLMIQSEEAREVADLTIRDYLETLYTHDRDNYSVKSGKHHPLKPGTVEQLIQAFPHWIDRKVGDVKKEWVQEFVDHWDSLHLKDLETGKPVLDPVTNKPVSTNSSETRRKKYTMLNAMFNMCAKRGYIPSNPIDGQIGRFPRSKFKSDVSYDYVFEEVIEHLFNSEDIKGSLAGKIVIATMILTGARNAEVYKNYTSNFDSKERTMFIPAEISKNNGQRKVKIENDTYWEFVALYLEQNHFINQFGHMFPSTKKNGHATEAIYRPVWETLKPAFNQEGRLYDVRHTFARRVTKEFGISQAAEVLGDSIETAHNHYVQGDEEEKFANMAAIQQTSREIEKPAQADFETPAKEPPAHQQDSSEQIVEANEEFMPEPVLWLFNMFKNGKVLPTPNQIYASQWQHFVGFVTKKHERSDLGEEVEDWLMMQ
ncbi:tyrosine-type recombinase/integrase [Agarivorans aestuarii]|uniref:Tyrosine-type recombinase/integrase n=1 Tax=Agarivorans aestuarii TaxID=1563703 RepID=A0ABU7G0L5_9ALTE|nr:tyrosine-type recombinase/integrase [Agarivorans aestuarii]MEE1672863.1 tyrosine-type recombinase/integrase [Agarivorans aestuarii]